MSQPQESQHRPGLQHGGEDPAALPRGWTMPTQRQPEPPRPPKPPKKRGRWLLALVVVVLLLLVGFVLGRYEPRAPAAAPTAAPATTSTSGSGGSTSSAPPSATAAPTPTEAAPQTFTGTGDEVVTLAPPRDYAVVAFSCPSCSGNVVVKADADLLVNEIGRYSGKTLYGMSGASASTPLDRVQVNAKGSWTLTVGGLGTARQISSPPTDGTGDDVLLISSPKDVATLSHAGRGNFAVWAATERGGVDLVVNEIGRYDGTVMLPADGGGMLIAVEADGEWTLN